jgi:hypothetical protein
MKELVVYWTSGAVVAFSVLFYVFTLGVTYIQRGKIAQSVFYTVAFLWVLGIAYIFYMRLN